MVLALCGLLVGNAVMKGRGSESEAAMVQAEECCLFMFEELKVVIENAAHIWVGVE